MYVSKFVSKYFSSLGERKCLHFELFAKCAKKFQIFIFTQERSTAFRLVRFRELPNMRMNTFVISLCVLPVRFTFSIQSDSIDFRIWYLNIYLNTLTAAVHRELFAGQRRAFLSCRFFLAIFSALRRCRVVVYSVRSFHLVRFVGYLVSLLASFHIISFIRCGIRADGLNP